jgi:hypothetical protein
MEKANITWRIFSVYMLVLLFVLLCGNAFGQIEIKHFNAGWNKANDVSWFMNLEDCETISYCDIGKDKEMQKEHKIAVVPTIIIFKDEEEVARFQADLSFKMLATREEVQEEINNQLMSDF